MAKNQQAMAAKAFAQHWEGKGYEKGESQSFWLQLLQSVFGVEARIEQTAQAILDARAKYQDCSLADLYDEVSMPVELRRAHQDNDRAVMAAYGMDVKTATGSSCVALLLEKYKELILNHSK